MFICVSLRAMMPIELVFVISVFIYIKEISQHIELSYNLNRLEIDVILRNVNVPG